MTLVAPEQQTYANNQQAYTWEPEAPGDDGLDAFLNSLLASDVPLSCALVPPALAVGFGISSDSSGTSWQGGWPDEPRARSRAADAAPQSRAPPTLLPDPALGPPPPQQPEGDTGQAVARAGRQGETPAPPAAATAAVKAEAVTEPAGQEQQQQAAMRAAAAGAAAAAAMTSGQGQAAGTAEPAPPGAAPAPLGDEAAAAAAAAGLPPGVDAAAMAAYQQQAAQYMQVDRGGREGGLCVIA